MSQLRESQRVLIAAMIGGLLGIIFGAITAFGAAHGDRTIRSGLDPAVVFLLSFLGWTLSAVVITELWKYVQSEQSANWIGMASITPLVITSLVVASPRSEFLSISELFFFLVGDVIGGIIVGELAWKHFGNAPTESSNTPDDG